MTETSKVFVGVWKVKEKVCADLELLLGLGIILRAT